MKTRRNLRTLALLLTTLFMLTTIAACSVGKARQDTKIIEETMPYGLDGMPALPEFEGGAVDYIEPMATTTAVAGQGPVDPITVAPPDSIRKIMSTVNAELLVPNVQDVVQKLKEETETLGGYVANASITEGGKYYYATISLRIPSAKVDGFTNGLSVYGKIIRQDSSTDDITDSYYDIEARLKNAKTQEAKLIEIMNQANTVEDLLRVRTELDQVQERIEQFQGKLKMWDQLTAYSTVNLSINEETKFSTNDDPVDKPMTLGEVWNSIKKGFSSSLNGIANFFSGLFIGLSYVIVPLLLLGVFALIIFLIVRAIIKKQAKKRPVQNNTMQAPYGQYLAPMQDPNNAEVQQNETGLQDK